MFRGNLIKLLIELSERCAAIGPYVGPSSDLRAPESARIEADGSRAELLTADGLSGVEKGRVPSLFKRVCVVSDAKDVQPTASEMGPATAAEVDKIGHCNPAHDVKACTEVGLKLGQQKLCDPRIDLSHEGADANGTDVEPLVIGQVRKICRGRWLVAFCQRSAKLRKQAMPE